MDIEQMNISGLIRFFLFSAMPPIMLSIVGGFVTSWIIKAYRKRKSRIDHETILPSDEFLHGKTLETE